MSAQAHVQPIIWFDLDEQTRFFARLKRALLLSLVLHLVVLLVAAGLRLPQRGERPLASVEVSLISLPTPVKRVEVQKPVELPKPPEPRSAPAQPMKMKGDTSIPTPKPAPVPMPVPIPATTPVRESVAKDILRDLQLPPDAPKFGELTPAKAVAQPQPQATRIKIPELPRIPDVMPDRAVKAPQQTSLS